MKLGGQSLRLPFWAAIIYCVLFVARASDDDLLDFDFTDLKEIDWNYENENSKELLAKTSTEQNKITFDDDDDLLEENQVHPFDWREKVLRTALSKALTNKAVRQKFVEVMPILRVLSKQQRLALSALITAQINAKKDNELKLEQVRMMFGDDKSLILPIVYDIANLVRNSAQKYIEFDYNLADFGDFSKTKISYERRNLDLTSKELEEETGADAGGIGTLPATAQIKQEMDLDALEDFMSEEVLDPKEINEELETLKLEKPKEKIKNDSREEIDDVVMDVEEEVIDDAITDPLNINHELQKDVPTLTLLKLNKTQVQDMLKNDFSTTETAVIPQNSSDTSKKLRRSRRSSRNSREFVHKLIRSVPLTHNEEDLQRAQFGRNLKLNTTAFASPKETTVRVKSTTVPTTTTLATSPIIVTPEKMQENDNYEPYQLVEDMAFASLNASDILLDQDDQHKDNDLTTSETKSHEPDDEILPTPEELIAGPRYRIAGNRVDHMRPKIIPAGKRKRVQIRAHAKQSVLGNGVPAPRKCERFTASMCIKTDDYPMDLIMGSIRRHRNAMTALLAEYSDKPFNDLDITEDFDDYLFAKRRREDNDVQSGLCQSIVRYARPQKALSASGEWKYIVNTGQHTQTLRLEKCTNPQESCSYVSSIYRSHCAQVYNYHRLLSWDKTRGLHVDIFKVPTCCSCQIDGYKQPFPALTSSVNKDFSPIYKNDAYQPHRPPPQQVYAQDDDEEDEDDFDFGLQHQYHQHDASFDANEVSSNRIRTKTPSPTVGSYLSPPDNEEYEQRYNYKNSKNTASVVVQHSPSSYSSMTSVHSSNNNYLPEYTRRRPQKSYSDGRSDMDYAPSEQHSDREVNNFADTPERTHQKRKNIYSVTHTAKASTNSISNGSTTSIPASTGIIRAVSSTSNTAATSPSPYLRIRRPTLFNTNAHQKPEVTATTLPTRAAAATTTAAISLSSAPATNRATASLPTYYYTRSRHVLKNQSRLRIPYTVKSTHARADSEKTASTTEYESNNNGTATPTTTLSSQQPDVYAVNPEIFKNYFKTKFNLTSYNVTKPTTLLTSSPTASKHPSTPPKRINYSYHPIIDYFEYNRRITTTTSSTTPRPTAPTRTTTPVTTTRRYVSSTQLYAHKIHKSIPAKSHNTHLQQKYQPRQQTERRIGYGADVAVTAIAGATTAAGDGSSGGVVFNTSPYLKQINTHFNTQTNMGGVNSQYSSTDYVQPPLEADVWHPVIIKDF